MTCTAIDREENISAMSELSSDVTELQQQVTTLQHIQSKLLESVNRKDGLIQQHTEDSERLLHKLALADAQLLELRNAAVDRDSQSNEVAKLNAQLKKCQDDAALNSSSTAKCATLQNELTQSIEQCNSLTQQLNSQTVELTSARASLAEREASTASLHATIERQTQQLAALCDKWEKQELALNEECQDWKFKLQELQIKCDNQKREDNSKHKHTVLQLQSTIDHLKSQLNASQSELSEIQSSHSELQSQFAHSQRQCTDAQNALTAQSHALEDAQSSLQLESKRRTQLLAGLKSELQATTIQLKESLAAQRQSNDELQSLQVLVQQQELQLQQQQQQKPRTPSTPLAMPVLEPKRLSQTQPSSRRSSLHLTSSDSNIAAQRSNFASAVNGTASPLLQSHDQFTPHAASTSAPQSAAQQRHSLLLQAQAHVRLPSLARLTSPVLRAVGSAPSTNAVQTRSIVPASPSVHSVATQDTTAHVQQPLSASSSASSLTSVATATTQSDATQPGLAPSHTAVENEVAASLTDRLSRASLEADALRSQVRRQQEHITLLEADVEQKRTIIREFIRRLDTGAALRQSEFDYLEKSQAQMQMQGSSTGRSSLSQVRASLPGMQKADNGRTFAAMSDELKTQLFTAMEHLLQEKTLQVIQLRQQVQTMGIEVGRLLVEQKQLKKEFKGIDSQPSTATTQSMSSREQLSTDQAQSSHTSTHEADEHEQPDNAIREVDQESKSTTVPNDHAHSPVEDDSTPPVRLLEHAPSSPIPNIEASKQSSALTPDQT